MQHRVRDQLMRQRTQLINALRAHMAELGIVAAQGREALKELLVVIADENANRLPPDARAGPMVLAAQLQSCQTLIGTLEKRIIAQHKSNDRSRRLETIPGIGVVGATAIDATVTDPKAFRSGRDFAAWIGLVPRRILREASRSSVASLSRGTIPATHSGRGCACRPAACPPTPGEVSLAHCAAGTAAVQDGRRGARQQNGPHGVGLVGQGWNVSTAAVRGSRLTNLVMGR